MRRRLPKGAKVKSQKEWGLAARSGRRLKLGFLQEEGVVSVNPKLPGRKRRSIFKQKAAFLGILELNNQHGVVNDSVRRTVRDLRQMMGDKMLRVYVKKFGTEATKRSVDWLIQSWEPPKRPKK